MEHPLLIVAAGSLLAIGLAGLVVWFAPDFEVSRRRRRRGDYLPEALFRRIGRQQ